MSAWATACRHTHTLKTPEASQLDKFILSQREPPDKNYFGGNYGKQNDPDRADRATAGARGREAAAASVYRRAAAGVRW